MKNSERDFIGYGANPPSIQWPNNARIAVSVVVNYEEGSETSLLDGDGGARVQQRGAFAHPGGAADLFNESFFEYGSRVGVWRILNLLDKYDVPSTFFCCAVAMERNREVAKGSGGTRPRSLRPRLPLEGVPQQDAGGKREEAIRKTVESLTETTGVRPVGWFTRYGPSVSTRELVVAEGGFIYDSGVFNDDLPYYTEVGGKPWPVLPYSFETNDARFWRGGLNSVGDFYEYLKDTFDVLYEEAAPTPK